MNTKLQSRLSLWLKDTSQTLYISNLNLKEWPDALKGKENLIIRLDCSDNELESIPTLPNLTYLRCCDNKLKSIPSLSKLTVLTCFDNKLKSIPSLPKLTYLHCYGNQLKSIPSLPKLTFLYCRKNQLESIPTLPNLTHLRCSQNQLKSIHNLPKLTVIDCSDNKLFSNDLEDWKKIWPLQSTYITSLREAGIKRFIKILKFRLYLVQLHQELLFSPYHPGKFYKAHRWGKWSK